MDEVKVIKGSETKKFMEGDEFCSLYFDTDKIVFGTSTLPPGRNGDVVHGHKNAYEIFFVAEGRILCYLPEENVYHELDEGDAILIPPPKPHQLYNMGEKTAVITWSQAKI